MFEGLVDRGASLVFVDMPQIRKKQVGSVATPFIGSNAYIRLHRKKSYLLPNNIIETLSAIKLILTWHH